MSRYILLIGSLSILLFTGCEKCMTCSYSYDETTIIQTVNGEEEEVNTFTGRFILDEDEQAWSQECIKTNSGDDFTIEDAYENEKQITDKDNFLYNCIEQ